jgi:hypothetical protein
MPKKKPMHPKNMTSDELLKHLFHPKVVKHVKKHVAKLNKSTMKKA